MKLILEQFLKRCGLMLGLKIPHSWDSSLLWTFLPTHYWCPKWNCQCKCATPLSLSAPYLCMATTLEVCAWHTRGEISCKTILRNLGPPLKKSLILSFFSLPKELQESSKLDTIFLSPCQFIGETKKRFLPYQYPFEISFPFFKMSILKAWHISSIEII